ncbi:hypothetical protein GOODEAATRI_007486 [Goodea atripinnis]|uniref:Uncharacterized protein n=1 Tax=Goodea atripinnis TaxID=208336 RepID=A0ABV0MFU0_9TELE
MTQLCQKWLIKPGPSAALINKEENLLQAHYNSIHSIIKSIPVLTLHSVCFWKRKQKQGRRKGGGSGCTPDSDLVQSTHPFPIIQNDTVEERLREKDSERKGMGRGSVNTRLLFFMYALFPHTEP